MYKVTVSVLIFPLRKVWNYTKSLNRVLEAPLEMRAKMSPLEVWGTKLVGGTSSVLFGKGVVDAAEAYACQDGVCVVSCVVGCTADVLGLATNFVPVANFTAPLAISISAGCKMFVHTCKNKTLPWNTPCQLWILKVFVIK